MSLLLDSGKWCMPIEPVQLTNTLSKLTDFHPCGSLWIPPTRALKNIYSARSEFEINHSEHKQLSSPHFHLRSRVLWSHDSAIEL